jgi:serine/threonine protein kinase
MAPTPATIGRYTVDRQIGQGGMANLYLATDPTLGRPVAVKVLREADSEELRERFLREARTVAAMNHPNIVSVFDVGEFEGGLFIAMEYLSGETLAQLIKRRAPLALARKLEIVREICAGLGHAHGRGVIHRDVKPANVILTDAGVAKVLDFGIARMSTSSMTQTGVVIGSLHYLSPEQIEGVEVDARSDIFSVGTLLYELLALRPAFTGSDLQTVVAQILRNEPAPLESLVPGLLPAIGAAVRKAMARERVNRYQDVRQLGEELARLSRAAALATAMDLAEASALPPAPAVATMPDATQIFLRPPAASVDPGPPPVPRPGSEAEGHTVILTPAAASALRADVMAEAQVVVVRSADASRRGRTVPVKGSRFTIGRGASCTLQLEDPMLSREHAAIEFGPSGFMLCDAGSTNGTFLNGRRLKRADSEHLLFGATIAVGDTVLGFSLAAEVKLPDLTGCRLADRYELARLIRDSARGAVYAGRDTRVLKDVAVKLMAPELMRFEGYREQFEREAAIGATLHHPYICQVLDRGEADVTRPDGPALRLSYLCLELMGGGSLQHRIREGPVPLNDVVQTVERVADALDYAHRHGIVHGDIKPSAIAYSADGHVYLTDFAFAYRALHGADGPALGAPAYVAPEVWDHQPLTAAADQFALAVVAYYAIAGSLPFAGQDSPDVRRRNFKLGPPAAHQEAASYRPDAVPKAVSTVLARAMSQQPDGRFKSATEFAAALAAAFRGRRADAGTANVFLSYQRDMSAGWANYFARELKDHGIATFLDVQQIDRAQQFPSRISRAIEECDVFVCLLGATTLQSAWVLEEIRQAHRCGKPMIPIFQESFDPAGASSAGDAAVNSLLSHDAVHLFDVRNVHVQHSAADLAALVKNTVARQ